MASRSDRVQGPTRRILRKRLFLVAMTSKVLPNALVPHLVDHLNYMTELEKCGVLFASGPMVDTEGKPTGEGLSIFNTRSAEEARALAEQDPFVIHGFRTVEVKPWILMEGSMTVTLKSAEQTFDVS
jgi:uncharacterized protein